MVLCFFFQAEDGIRDLTVTGVQTCALPIYFDELIKERNLANKCGYVFCPREPRVDNAKGKSRILGKSSIQNFKIVDADKIAHWCSDDCVLRALHISFQLNEEDRKSVV